MDNIKKQIIFLLLLVGAVIVLLPMLWMVITALKQPGQGLKFNFIPQTKYQTKKYTIPVNKKVVYFEYKGDASVTKVSVAGSFNNWDKEKNLLTKNGDVFIGKVMIDKPGKYEYKLVINGNSWIVDPINKNTQNGNSVIEIKNLFNYNTKLTTFEKLDFSKVEDNKLIFKYHNSQTKFVNIIFKNNDKLKMQKQEGTLWTLTVPNRPEYLEYRYELSRSFSDAFSVLYTFDNFNKVLFNKDFPFFRFFINSLIVAFLAGSLTVIICTLGGYAFAKKQFLGRDKIFLLLMASMMIPGMIFMVPQYAIISKLGWINSYMGMVVPHLANVFGIFLLRQYIKTIPNSLFEAATIDGANEFQIFRIIVIPLSLPIIITLFLLTFLGQWSNFLWQLIVNTPDSLYRTLPVGLALFKGQYSMDWELIMAGSCFSIIPIAILFLFAQRFFMEGMTGGAVKE